MVGVPRKTVCMAVLEREPYLCPMQSATSLYSTCFQNVQAEVIESNCYMTDKVTVAAEWLRFQGSTSSGKTQRDRYDCLTVFIEWLIIIHSFSIYTLSLFFCGKYQVNL